MDRWRGKIAVVTGASAGIGAATAEKLVQNGLQVVGLARRLDKVEELSKKLSNASGKLFPFKCDIANEEDILKAFKWIKDNLGVVHILINNAGVLNEGFLYNGKTEIWRKTLDINVIGLCICTREAVQAMIAGDVDGHIIHLNSIAGHEVIQHHPPAHGIYPASKFAVTALTEQLRQEFVYLGSSIRVTSISPGLTHTEMYTSILTEEEQKMKPPILLSEDVANAIIYVLGAPPHVQIKELTIKPTGEKE